MTRQRTESFICSYEGRVDRASGDLVPRSVFSLPDTSIIVEGRPVKKSVRVRPGDRVTVYWKEEVMEGLVSDYVLTKHLEDGEESRKEAREFVEGVLSTVLDLFEGMPAQIREISMRNTSYVQATRAILEFRLNNFRDIEGALNRSLKLLRKVDEDEIETPFAPYQMATIAPESIYKPRNLQRRAPGEVPFEEGEVDEEAVLRAERFLREEKRYGKSAILAFLESVMDQESELASDLHQDGLDGFIKLSLTPSYAPEGYRIGAPTGERFPLGEFLLDDYLIERKGD